MACTLLVQGFQGHLAGLNGSYHQADDNHGRATFAKRPDLDNTTTGAIYYWDDRDGEKLAGWWFAPEIGGTEVWAHAPVRTVNPPARGWRVPWHNGVPDPKVLVELRGASKIPTGIASLHAVKNAAKSAFSQKTGLGAVSDYNQTGATVSGVQALTALKRFKQAASGITAPLSSAAKTAKEKVIVSINSSVTNVETQVLALSKPSDDPNFDLNRGIILAKNAVNTALRAMDNHVRSGSIDEQMIVGQKQKLQSLEREVMRIDDDNKKNQKKKLESLRTTFVTDLQILVGQAEDKVEKTKDAAVMFTCEMAEHIKPEDSVEGNKKTITAAEPASEALKAAKDFLFHKDREIRGFSQAEVQGIRENIKPLNLRLANAEKELAGIKNIAATAQRKAQVSLNKKKKRKKLKKQKKKESVFKNITNHYLVRYKR